MTEVFPFLSPGHRKSLMRWVFLLFALGFLASSSTRAEAPADLVLLGGKVWTVHGPKPEAEAVAVRGGRIVAVGRDVDVKPFLGAKTRTIRLAGRRVLPGFYDSHVHMLGSGLRLAQVALKDAKDEAEFAKRLRAFDRKLPRGRWMLGGEWDHDRTFAGKLPDAALLDKYVPDRPVFLRRYDGHMGVANSLALKRAGITAKVTDPPGGVIYHKAGSKEPTGLLRDNAMNLVEEHIPAPTIEEISEAITAALQEARALGVTSVQDMDGSDSETRRQLFRLYQKLARTGKLTTRIDLRWPLAEWQALANLGVEANFGNDFVRIGGVKGFVDGSLGSSTAKLFDAYLNEPGSTGIYVTAPAKLRQYIEGADRAGLSVAVHAIGDEANARLLDVFAEVIKKNGPRDRRFRIEHAQHLRPRDYARFKALGVIASMQPYHIIDDGRWAEGRIGPKRCASSYANRSLLDAGAKLAFGSDWSVAPLDPLLGIDAAVHRRTLDGKHPKGWFAAQKISVEEAIEGYTLGSAFAAGQEKERGSVQVGKLADLVVLSRDILAKGEIDRISETKVEITILGGRVVYERSKKSGER
jgi:predicted amidohydrolase YtcJ